MHLANQALAVHRDERRGPAGHARGNLNWPLHGGLRLVPFFGQDLARDQDRQRQAEAKSRDQKQQIGEHGELAHE